MSTAGDSAGRIELFHGLFPAQSSAFARLGSEVGLARGDPLFALGDRAERLYVVRSGRVAFTMPILIRGQSREAFVDEKGPGSVIGWSALAPPYKYTLSARAMEDTELTAFAGDELRAQLTLDPPAGVTVLLNLVALLGHRVHLTQAMWLRELQRTVDARQG